MKRSRAIKHVYLLAERKFHGRMLYTNGFVLTKAEAIQWCRNEGQFRQDTVAFGPAEGDDGHCYADYDKRLYRTWTRIEKVEIPGQ